MASSMAFMYSYFFSFLSVYPYAFHFIFRAGNTFPAGFYGTSEHSRSCVSYFP
jgi:hypothetical protein